MQIIFFVSQKGISGKTTIALHIVVAAEQKGHKVALIDIAIQAKVSVAVVLSSCPAIRGFAKAAIVKEARQTFANDYEILVWSGQISQRVAYYYALIDGCAAQ